MKYYITINQLVLSETDLDVIDGAILDYIYFYCNTPNEKVKKQRITDEEGEIWTWIDYQSLIKDMPMLKFKSAGVLTLRINKIEKTGYIKTKRFQHMKKYFCMTAKSEGLFILMNRAIQSREQVKTPNKADPIQSREPIKVIKNKYINSKDLELAKLLYELIKKENPAWYVKPNWDIWAEDIRKIRELDNRTPEQIEFVIKWVQKDPFWKSNILSPAKLRKQFNSLIVKCKNQKTNNGITVI